MRGTLADEHGAFGGHLDCQFGCSLRLNKSTCNQLLQICETSADIVEPHARDVAVR